MDEFRQKIRARAKLCALILAAGVGFAALAALVGAVAGTAGLEYRAGVIGVFWLLGTLCAFAWIGSVFGMIGALFGCPLRKTLHRVLLRLGCAVLAGALLIASLYGGLFAFLCFAFSIRDERTAVIDGTAYVARLETTGLETTGISYHRIVGLLFCEKSGWETEFDYERWRSY